MPNITEFGTSGLRRWGGQVTEEFHKHLEGGKAVEVYREMSLNDPVIGAFLFTIKNLIRRASWNEVAASESNEDKQNAEFIKTCRLDMSHTWEDTLSEILSMLIFGWSMHEVVLKRRLGENRDPSKNSRFNDGRYGWRKIPIRAQETLSEWMWDEQGGIQGMKQRNPVNGDIIPLPIEVCLLFRTALEKNSPEGKSLLRTAYLPYYYKSNIQVFEAVGIERDLNGLPMVGVPPELLLTDRTAEQTAQFNAILQMATNVRKDEQGCIIIPLEYDDKGLPRWTFSLLSTSGTGSKIDTNEVIQRYDQRIAMSVLADAMLLGSDKVGSQSMHESKAEQLATALETILNSVTAVFNRIAIPRLFRDNGIKTDKLPEYSTGRIDRVDLKELGAYIKELAGSGILFGPDEELENYLRQAGNLPERPDDIDQIMLDRRPLLESPEPEEEDDDEQDEKEKAAIADIRAQLDQAQSAHQTERNWFQRLISQKPVELKQETDLSPLVSQIGNMAEAFKNQPPPIVNVDAHFHVPPDQPRTVVKTIDRDGKGLISKVTETPE